MKLSLATVTTLMAASTPGAMADWWDCNGSWNDGGLKRLSFKFRGYCEDRHGQCFLGVIRGKGVPVHNWQCWKTDDGSWQADLSITAGLAWQVNNAIQDITGTWRGCWGGQ